MTLGRIPDLLDAVVEQHLQNRALVIRGAADQKIAGRFAPVFLEPVDIGFEPAGCRDQRSGPDSLVPAADPRRRGQEHAVLDVHRRDLGLVQHIDADPLRRIVQRVEHRPSAAEEKRVGPSQPEGAAERGLEPDALLHDPVQHVFRFVNHVPGEFFVRLALRNPEQVFEQLVLGIGARQRIRRFIVGAAHVAGMARIAAAIEFLCPLQHKHRSAFEARADGGAKCRVAAADDEDIVFFC